MGLPVSVTNESGNPKAAALAGGFVSAFEGQSSVSEREKLIIDSLRSTHNDYKANEAHWRFMLRAYEGGPAYVGPDTLFKHVREHEEDFADRLLRSTYQNFCQPLVDFVPEYIFKDPIDRSADPSLQAEFDSFLPNVDKAGTPMSEFMRTIAENVRIYGKAFIQVDKLPVPEGINPAELSVLDAEALGLDKPYFINVGPLEVLDWRTDRFGNYVYIKRAELDFVDTLSGFVDVERYTEWYANRVEVSVVSLEDPHNPRLLSRDVLPNTLGRVPFVAVVAKKSKSNRDLGISFLNDIAYQNRHVFNLTSLIEEFLFRQCFNVLAMEKDTAIPTRESVDGTIGTSNVLEVPRQATHFPQYVSPPVDPAKFIQSERQSMIEEMYRQAAQDVTSELWGGSNQSGDAAKQAFGRSVPPLARLADALQQAEVSAFVLWAKLLNKVWKGKIAYRDDFSVTNLQDLLLQLTMIFNSLKVLSPTFIREEWKRIIREFDGRLPQDIKEKIEREINELKDEDLVAYYKGPEVSDVGQPTTSQMIEGKEQDGSTDRRLAMQRGRPTQASKETLPDRRSQSK